MKKKSKQKGNTPPKTLASTLINVTNQHRLLDEKLLSLAEDPQALRRAEASGELKTLKKKKLRLKERIAAMLKQQAQLPEKQPLPAAPLDSAVAFVTESITLSESSAGPLLLTPELRVQDAA